MVDVVVDPHRPSVLSLSGEEIEAIEAEMAAGTLPQGYLEKHFDAVDANVFGHDAPKDRNGHRLEQGLGSPGNMTANAVAAYEKWGKDEPNYDKSLSLMRKQLAESDARRKAAAPTRRHAGRSS